jgi:hypothetical protein
MLYEKGNPQAYFPKANSLEGVSETERQWAKNYVFLLKIQSNPFKWKMNG